MSQFLIDGSRQSPLSLKREQAVGTREYRAKEVVSVERQPESGRSLIDSLAEIADSSSDEVDSDRDEDEDFV